MNPGKHPRRLTLQAKRFASGGFTLLELLVVVAILVLLVTILIPWMANARLLAKRAACEASLRNIGVAAGMYSSDFGEYVPICWKNYPTDGSYVNPWKSWRTNLLPYTCGFAVFNCPAGKDTGAIGEVFHSDAEITGHDLFDTSLAGSYGVMYQTSLPSYTTVDCYGNISPGHPQLSSAFSTVPGVAWANPSMSVYIADSYTARGSIIYPSQSYKGYGASNIIPPSDPAYLKTSIASQRFADRHCGTNCLFVGGNVVNYQTKDLDSMKPGDPNCVWDTK